MVNIEEIKKYISKLARIVNSADLAIFNSSIVKKNRVDDILVCIIALLPDSFKKTMKKRISIDVYPSVASFNRLSKIIKKPLFLLKDFYIFKTSEAITLIQNISKNIERDINRLEEEENNT